MRSATYRIAQACFTLVLALCCAYVPSKAQYAEKYIISAKAGAVNLISGGVSVRRSGETEWRRMAPKAAQPESAGKKERDDLFNQREVINAGDHVRTEDTGRFEVLLNPGSYLRLAENSEMELIDTQLDSLRIKMIKGSAIIEATGSGDVQLLTEIATPHTKLAIIRTGLYRINVVPSNSTELIVYKGRAVIGTDMLTTVKGGKRASVIAGLTQVSKFDKKSQDSFDFWSKSRAEILIAANGNLSDSELSHAILSSGMRPLRTGVGLWVYDPFIQSHTFFPYYSGWNSPYGRGYNSSFGYSSDWYRPSQTTTNGSHPQPVGGNPAVVNNPGDRRSIRERKNEIRDELPIRPVESETRGHRSEGRHDSAPRERMDEGSRSSQRSEPFRNSSPSPRQEPTYTPRPSAEGNSNRISGDHSGPKGRRMDPQR